MSTQELRSVQSTSFSLLLQTHQFQTQAKACALNSLYSELNSHLRFAVVGRFDRLSGVENSRRERGSHGYV